MKLDAFRLPSSLSHSSTTFSVQFGNDQKPFGEEATDCLPSDSASNSNIIFSFSSFKKRRLSSTRLQDIGNRRNTLDWLFWGIEIETQKSRAITPSRLIFDLNPYIYLHMLHLISSSDSSSMLGASAGAAAVETVALSMATCWKMEYKNKLLLLF